MGNLCRISKLYDIFAELKKESEMLSFCLYIRKFHQEFISLHRLAK